MAANFPAFWKDTYALYDKLVNDYGYLEENVYLLYSSWLMRHTAETQSGLSLSSPSAKVSVDDGSWEDVTDDMIKWGEKIDVKVEGSLGEEWYQFTSDKSFHNTVTVRFEFYKSPYGFWRLLMYASEYIWEDWSNNNPKINGECTKEDFEESLEKIGEKTTINDFIFIGFAMHGGGGDLPHEQHEVLFRLTGNIIY